MAYYYVFYFSSPVLEHKCAAELPTHSTLLRSRLHDRSFSVNTASVTDTSEVRSGPQASLSLFGTGFTGVAHLGARGGAVLAVFMCGVQLTVPGLAGVTVAVIVVAVVEVVDALEAVAVVRATVVQSE